MTRHAVHLGAGQVFPEEDEAARLLFNLSQQMPIIVVASSVLDLFLVFLFQKFLHPWRRILAAVILIFSSWTQVLIFSGGHKIWEWGHDEVGGAFVIPNAVCQHFLLQESAAAMRRISFATISQREEFDARGLENPTNCSSRETVNTDCGL